MKKPILGLLSMTLATAAIAEIGVPGSVFTFEEIEQPKEEATETEVEFLMPDGKTASYPLEKLSPESREEIAELKK
jgi:hypothetical protein